jgi:hypothetical protein
MRKFCKCAEGTYGYKSYKRASSRRYKNAQYYKDPRNNENWATKISSQYKPVYKVKCKDNKWYYTNRDYYYG